MKTHVLAPLAALMLACGAAKLPAQLIEVTPVYVQAGLIQEAAPRAKPASNVRQASLEIGDPVPSPHVDDVPSPLATEAPSPLLADTASELPMALEEACCCPPCGWVVAADYVVMDRSSSNRVLYNHFDPTAGGPDEPSGPPAMRVPDFEFESGVRVSALYQHCCGYDLELVYMGLEDWSATSAIEGTPPPPPYEMNFLYGIGFDVDAAAVRYQSDLDTFEANLRTCLTSRLAVLLGVRYINIDESLHFSQTSAGGALEESLGTTTKNDMLGIQFGGEFFLWDNCCRGVSVASKLGVLFNDQSAASFYQTDPTIFVDGTQASADNNEASFFLDVAVTGRICINSCLSVRGGYRLLYVTDVATAVSQLDTTQLDPFSPISIAVGNDEVFYHGGFVGLEFAL